MSMQGSPQYSRRNRHVAMEFYVNYLTAELRNMADKLGILNVDQWVEENKDSFVPPVCNKLMYACLYYYDYPCGTANYYIGTRLVVRFITTPLQVLYRIMHSCVTTYSSRASPSCSMWLLYCTRAALVEVYHL